MARMHTRKRGKSGSHKPFRTEPPSWVPLRAAEIEDRILALAGEGLTTSIIGQRLRDQEGVPNVKLSTGKRIAQILAARGKPIEFPEDLKNLIRKAAKVQGHLTTNIKDLHTKRNLSRIEAKIRRLVAYYKDHGVLGRDWIYSLDTAKLLVQ